MRSIMSRDNSYSLQGKPPLHHFVRLFAYVDIRFVYLSKRRERNEQSLTIHKPIYPLAWEFPCHVYLGEQRHHSLGGVPVDYNHLHSNAKLRYPPQHLTQECLSTDYVKSCNTEEAPCIERIMLLENFICKWNEGVDGVWDDLFWADLSAGFQ